MPCSPELLAASVPAVLLPVPVGLAGGRRGCIRSPVVLPPVRHDVLVSCRRGFTWSFVPFGQV